MKATKLSIVCFLFTILATAWGYSTESKWPSSMNEEYSSGDDHYYTGSTRNSDLDNISAQESVDVNVGGQMWGACGQLCMGCRLVWESFVTFFQYLKNGTVNKMKAVYQCFCGIIRYCRDYGIDIFVAIKEWGISKKQAFLRGIAAIAAWGASGLEIFLELLGRPVMYKDIIIIGLVYILWDHIKAVGCGTLALGGFQPGFCRESCPSVSEG